MDLYRIKPLMWFKVDHKRWRAETPWGQYRVSRLRGGQFCWDYSGEFMLLRDCDSIESGKAEAEAHYSDRLMNALESVWVAQGDGTSVR